MPSSRRFRPSLCTDVSVKGEGIRYTLERLLYCLSKSKHRDKFVLKGAMLMRYWLDDPRHRRQVAGVAIDHAEQRADGGLSGRDRVEITHATRLQRAQIVRHVAEFSDDCGIAKISGGGIARAAESDRAYVAFLAREHVRAHHRCIRTETFDWLAGRDTIVCSDEGQHGEVGDFRHPDPRL
jgi:hypothetical protein